MARGRRTANTTAAPSNEPQPATSSIEDFDAEASLLALQKHVDAASSATNAAANGAVHADAGTQPPATAGAAAPATQPLAPGQLYAASAAQLFARQNQAAASLESDPEAQIHPDLRSAQASLPSPVLDTSYTPVPNNSSTMATAVQPQPQPQPSGVPAAAIPQGTSPVAAAPASAQTDAPITDGRKGPRRELSQSKRAAQNRAAQRAFRQRKEGYIKKLEQQVQDYADMESQFKAIQSENYALREYIIHLQSKLLDAKADLPQPPPNLNLPAPGSAILGGLGTSASTAAANLLANAAAAAAIQQQQQRQQQPAQQTPVPVPVLPATGSTAAPPTQAIDNDTPLARVAQAVAQLGNGNNSVKEEPPARSHQKSQSGDAMDTSADEIDRQLQGPSETLTATPVASM